MNCCDDMIKDIILQNMKLATWLKVINIEDTNIIKQSKKTDLTYSHIRNIYTYLHNCGIVYVEKVGRQCEIKLTEKGKRLKELFGKIDKELADVDGKTPKIAEVRSGTNN
jgi:predicted transcriptional regulator